MDTLLKVLLGTLLWRLACVRSQEIQQSPQSLIIQEGEEVTIGCNSTQSLYSLQWYWQKPGEGLTFLMILRKGGKERLDKITATLDEKKQHSSLYITASQLSHSGTYFCAGFPNNNNNLRFGAGTRLTVKPNVKNPDPAVYQLRSPKSSNTSVCLFTDFDSKINVSQEPVSSVFSSNSMALDMRAVGSKSNGALRWSASPGFLCEETFNKTFYSSSGIPCDATLIEKSFETDMNLNFQNLSVIGLRILLLKVAGFNLLMTLRLWSS